MFRIFKVASLAALISACAIAADAQTQKTITFGTSKATNYNSKNKKSKNHRRDYGKNSLTLNAFSFLDGVTAVNYERMLTESITISGGVGITHKNFWMRVGDLVRYEGYSNGYVTPTQYDIEDDYSDLSMRKPMIGTYFCVAPKFYPRHESLDGTYIMPLIEYRNYRFSALRADESVFKTDYNPEDDDKSVPRTTQRVNETVRCLDISAVWGGHYQLQNHIVLGYSIGIGLRNVKSTRLDLGYTTVAQDTYHYTNNMTSFNDTRYLFNCGFTLGGWW